MTRTPSLTRTPTATGTPTPADPGPRISYFGIFRADACPLGCVAAACCSGTPTATPRIENGIEVFEVLDPRAGIIVVEGFPRPGGASLPNPPLLDLAEDDPRRPDIWFQTNKARGNGSVAVCDKGAPAPIGGGIPGIPTPSFEPMPPDSVLELALKDAACRFEAFTQGTPCTRNAFGNPRVADPAPTPRTTLQYCHLVNSIEAFTLGDTLVTVELRDRNGQVGPTAQIIVRVVTPHP